MSVGSAARLTPDDLLAMPGGKNYELIDGELVQLEMNQESGWIAGQVHFHLVFKGERTGLGWAFSEGTCYACFTDDPYQVRRPDASFVIKSRQPEGPTTKGHGRTATQPRRRSHLSA